MVVTTGAMEGRRGGGGWVSLESKDAAKYFPTGQAPTTKNYPVQNINSVEVEKSYPKFTMVYAFTTPLKIFSGKGHQ